MSITADFTQAIEGLQAIAARTADMSPFMAMMGEFERDMAKSRITDTKSSPEANPWAQWSSQRRKERIAKGNESLGLLLDTGTLLNSINAVSTIHGFEVGTDLDYAADLQNGTWDMPARPFLGWTPGEIATTERLAVFFIEKGTLL
jgi:phage gpG-like protein